MRAAVVLLLSWTAFGQSAFDVASVKPSQHIVGKDYGNEISTSPTTFSGKNVTLKRLIEEAYRLPPHQVSGALNWLDVSEYDIEATMDAPTTRDQLLLMLRTLLTDRFGLAFHREQKEMNVYELVTEKGGAKIQPAKGTETVAARRGERFYFRGDMQQFANLLAVQLTIPVMVDPATPAIGKGVPPPVIDKTGLEGIYDIDFDLKLELGTESFTLWQRALQGLMGLKLESQKAKVDVLVVDRAARTPTAN